MSLTMEELLRCEVATLKAELEAVKRERDALMCDFETVASLTFSACIACKHSPGNGQNCPRCCDSLDCFEWRGMCEENGGIEA